MRFHGGDLVGARDDYARAATLDPEDMWLLLLGGISARLQGDRSEALELVRRAGDVAPEERYPAIFRVVLGDPPSVLDRHLRDPQDWYDHFVAFCAGRRSMEELLAEAARGSSPWRVRERSCEAHAFIGMLAERDGDLEAARRHYRAALDTEVFGFIEYRWAMNRLTSPDLR